jgi:diketogulonate reductase-like aldo/keto reductase
MATEIPRVRLNNGIEMPVLGLGVWQLRDGAEAENAVRWALDAGYRLIDTAKMYGNERSVGRAIRASGIPREEILVTTKIWPTDFFHPEAAFERSLAKLDIGTIDLYLIHHPVDFIPGFRALRRRVWQALEREVERKRVRAIGVSNYSIARIGEVLSGGAIPPAVNQVRFNPFDFKKELLAFCKAKNIAIESYSPLTRARRLHHPAIERIAAAHARTPAQVLIRWALQQGTIVIPKSSRRERIEENARVFDFELTPDEMATLDALSP